MPVQPDPPSVVSPKTPAKRADYAFLQLVPLHPLPHSTIACCRCKGFTTGSASLRIPGVSQRIQDSLCLGTLSMAITCDKSPLSSGRTVDAWCNQGLARERSCRASGTSGEIIHLHNISSGKRNGSGQYRPVINLKALNRFVESTPFKMESLQIVKSLLQPGDYMMKLDLKDAYYAIPVYHKHRHYLRFIFQDKLYEFHCLPFGLSSAPRALTKMLKPVAALLRSQGICVVFYLDDILLLHQSKETMENISSGAGFTPEPGLHNHLCQWPYQLGDDELIVTSGKLCAITTTAKEVLQIHKTSLQILSTLLGWMNHASQTGLWIAPLDYRSLQRDLIKALHSSSSPSQLMKIAPSPSSLEELRWWESPNIQNFNGQPLQTFPIEMTVSTDASFHVKTKWCQQSIN